MRFGENAGFICLSAEEVRGNLKDALACVLLDGARVVLHQAGKKVAANIPAPTPEKVTTGGKVVLRSI
jgi:hypothetical protein